MARTHFFMIITSLSVFLITACAGPTGQEEQSAEEQLPTGKSDYLGLGAKAIGAQVAVCQAEAVNLRSGPSTQYQILKVIEADTVGVIKDSTDNWYKVSMQGSVGWMSGRYLCLAKAPQESMRDQIINTSKAMVGFSYWWGGAALTLQSGAEKGQCLDYDFSQHTGQFGADCSGFVGKMWQLAEAMPLEENKHPFSTVNFRYETQHWSPIERSELQPGDALVYNTDGKGHILIYAGTDSWGQYYTYEAASCDAGIIHAQKSVGDNYIAIRKEGL